MLSQMFMGGDQNQWFIMHMEQEEQGQTYINGAWEDHGSPQKFIELL